MTRRVLFVLSLVGLAACSGEPSQPSDPVGGPAFEIQDGSDPGGRPDFAWRPPIGNTTIGGTFDGTRNPTVRICVLDVANEACIGADVFTAASVPVVNANYQVDWTVPISPVTHYRIFVQTVNPSVILGFADVRTAATSKGLKGNDPNEFVGITDGSILPIKFRITDACEDQDCGGGTIDTQQGGTAYHTDENGETVGGITIPPTTGGGIVTVSFATCPDLPIDNPKFGSCVTVDVDEDGTPYDGAGVAFVCDAEAAVGSLDPAQQELVTLHRKHDNDPVEALPHAADQCPTIITIGSVKGLFRALVQGKWKKAGQQLAGLIAPKPLYARRLDAGAGGAIADGGFSDFQFALPATIELVTGDDQVALAGSTLPTDPTVLVKDFLGNPVANATVHFSALGGSSAAPTSVLTGPSGTASVDWTLGPAGDLSQDVMLAYGVGLAAANKNGPRGTVDPFLPLMDHAPFNDGTDGPAFPLDTGVVTFTATPIEGFETASGWGQNGFWHRSTLAGIVNQAFVDSLVRLAPGDFSVGALPSPFAGSFAYWYGTEVGLVGSENGNYIGTRSANNVPESFSGGESTAPNGGVLSSSPFVVPADGMLRFETWWEIESVDPHIFDLMTLDVEEVGVGTTTMGTLNPVADPNGAAFEPFTTNGYNAPPGWVGFNVSLGAYAGKTVRLHFAFTSGDHQYNGFRGWLLDNVRVVPEPIIIGLRALSTGRTLNPPRPAGTRRP